MFSTCVCPMLEAAISACCSALFFRSELHSCSSRYCTISAWPRRAAWTRALWPLLSAWSTYHTCTQLLAKLHWKKTLSLVNINQIIYYMYFLISFSHFDHTILLLTIALLINEQQSLCSSSVMLGGVKLRRNNLEHLVHCVRKQFKRQM